MPFKNHGKANSLRARILCKKRAAITDQPFDSKRLGKVIIELLGFSTGDSVEIKRDRLDRNRLMIIRIPKSVGDGSD